MIQYKVVSHHNMVNHFKVPQSKRMTEMKNHIVRKLSTIVSVIPLLYKYTASPNLPLERAAVALYMKDDLECEDTQQRP